MCCTPAGLCHFLSVYSTAYPPQDYREKKRREQWQERPFPLSRAPARSRTLALSRSGQKKRKKKVEFTCKCVSSDWRRAGRRVGGWGAQLGEQAVTSPLAGQRPPPTCESPLDVGVRSRRQKTSDGHRREKLASSLFPLVNAARRG